MSEYVDFHYMPLEGKITGEQVLKQTEDAINDLGEHVYGLDIDESRIDEAVKKSEQAIETADSALSAVTTDRAVWKNTVAEMKATDIDLGVTAATRGKMVFNDGNGAFYGVRSEKSGDVDSDDTVFLNNGNVAERIQSMNIIAKGNNIIFVANVAELIDSDALIGNVYGTTGYYSANDGGAGLYSIRTKESGDVEDGGSIIFLDNGNVAECIDLNIPRTFDTVADLKNASLFVGLKGSTKGYYSVNDGGSAFYSIREKTVSDVEDGGSIIFLDNQNVAELITDGTVCLEQFGAVGDGVEDDSDALQKAINAGFKVIANKTYSIAHIDFPADKDVDISGTGAIIPQKNSDGSLKYVFKSVNAINIRIKGLTIQSDHDGSWVSEVKSESETIFLFNNATSVVLDGLTLDSILVYNSGVSPQQDNISGYRIGKINYVSNVYIHNLKVTNCCSEAITIYTCGKVRVNNAYFNSDMLSLMDFAACGETIFEESVVYGTRGNSVNVNTSNAIVRNSKFYYNSNNSNPAKIDVSNEYENGHAELRGVTIKNVVVENNVFEDSLVGVYGATINADKPDNYNQIDDIYVINNVFHLTYNQALFIPNERRFGTIYFCNNYIYGTHNTDGATRKVVQATESNAAGTLKIYNNTINMQYTTVNTSTITSCILIQNNAINVEVKGNTINAINALYMNTTTGNVTVENNKITAHYGLKLVDSTGAVNVIKNEYINVSTNDNKTYNGSLLSFDGTPNQNITLNDNYAKCFNIVLLGGLSFNKVEICRNYIYSNSTQVNSGIRTATAGVTATELTVMNNTIILDGTQTALIIANDVATPATVLFIGNNCQRKNAVIIGNGNVYYAGNVCNNLNTSSALSATQINMF